MAKASEDPPSPVDAYAVNDRSSASAPPPPPVPPAYGTVPPYGTQPQYYYGTPQRTTNVLAIVSLIAACAALIVPFFGSLTGIITGHIALGQIKRTGEGGRGLALGGIIVGYSFLAITILFIVAYIIFIFAFIGIAGEASNFNGSDFG